MQCWLTTRCTTSLKLMYHVSAALAATGRKVRSGTPQILLTPHAAKRNACTEREVNDVATPRCLVQLHWTQLHERLLRIFVVGRRRRRRLSWYGHGHDHALLDLALHRLFRWGHARGRCRALPLHDIALEGSGGRGR